MRILHPEPNGVQAPVPTRHVIKQETCRPPVLVGSLNSFWNKRWFLWYTEIPIFAAPSILQLLFMVIAVHDGGVRKDDETVVMFPRFGVRGSPV